MSTSKEVGAALRALRLEQKIGFAHVHGASGVRSLVAVETGRASATDMDRVARALGTTLIAVMQTEKHPAPTSYGRAMDLSQVAEAFLNLQEGLSRIDRLVDEVVLRALKRQGGNQSAAARGLGMERKAYVRRLLRAQRAAKRSR